MNFELNYFLDMFPIILEGFWTTVSIALLSLVFSVLIGFVLAAAGSAVVMVCHDMEVVSDFADRLVVMANGEILGRGTCADVFANDGLMQSAFVEPPQAIALAKRLAAEVSPAFVGLSEVSDIVAVAKELACRA